MGVLENYLKEQLAAGYSYEQLATQLESQGYRKEKIEAAYTAIQQETYRKQLNSYVQEQLAQGAKPRELERQLKDQGYEPTLVHGLLYPHHRIEHHHIISFLVLLLLAVGAGIAYFTFLDVPAAAEQELPVLVELPCQGEQGQAIEYCLLDLSLEQGVVRGCEELTNLTLREDCYFAHLRDGSPVSCSNFELERNKHICETYFLTI